MSINVLAVRDDKLDGGRQRRRIVGGCRRLPEAWGIHADMFRDKVGLIQFQLISHDVTLL